MDSAAEDLYYQRINELVCDEEKIVTTVSLAAELKLSLSESCQLLEKYFKDEQALKHELNATFLLSGILKDSKGLGIYMVKENELNQKRQLFESLTVQQVYSIQKCKSLDLNAIALLEPSIDVDCQGVFISKNCTKRISKKAIMDTPVQPSTSKTSKQPSFFKKIETKIEENLKKGENSDEKKPSTQNTRSSKGKGGIASFFSKASPPSVKVTETKSPKVNEDKVSESSAMKENCVNDGNKIEVEKMDVDNNEQASVPVKDDIKEVSAFSNCKKRKKTEKRSEMPNKKRKRIQEIVDSDSSDIFEDDEDEDIIEKSDEEPIQPPAKSSIVEPVKNKRRKAVDKTYMDEEGYIVTTTEYVYESASDKEEEKLPEASEKVEEKSEVIERKNSTTDSENDAKRKTGKSKKTNKKPVHGKQPTLMSFFTKV